MIGVELKVSDLRLDLENPRISKASSQREALQKIIEDQDVRLVVLAESIVEDGLNPMDRWLVTKSESEKGKFIVLEGNRRLAAIKILNNATVLDDLEVRTPIKKRLKSLSAQFLLKSIEPISCFEIEDRKAGASWLNQRHTGANKGRGIVDWGGVATARFRGNDPALQALDFVIEHGNLSDEEKEQVADRFPITTLDRLLSTPDVRNIIGVEIVDTKLRTELPPEEVMKPLRKIVLDLADASINVTKLKLKDQQVLYAKSLMKNLPDLTKKSGKSAPISALEDSDFATAPKKEKPAPKPKPKKPVRKALIPRDCYLTVSNPKIAEISNELRKLGLADFPHSISVLFRVFLEQSVDHYLSAQGIPLEVKTAAGNKDKNLRSKVTEAIDQLVKGGVPKKNIASISKGIDDKNSPLYINTLHDYVHNRFYSATVRELTVAWDNSQPFFEGIWK